MNLLFVQNIRTLPQHARALIFLFWGYLIVQIISDVFINIYILLVTETFVGLILYNIIMFIGGFCGFVCLGLFLLHRGHTIKMAMKSSFVMYICAFIFILLAPKTEMYMYIFGYIQGLGLGLFWMALHSLELKNIIDSKRDIYLSILEAGKLSLSILIPFLSTVILFLGGYIGEGVGYVILFLFLIILSILLFFVVNRLPSVTTRSISLSEIKNIHTSIPKTITKYYFFSSFSMISFALVINAVSLVVLKDVVQIGIYETIFSCVSVVVTLLCIPLRKGTNRWILMCIGAGGVMVSGVFLFLAPTSIFLYITFMSLYVLFRPFWAIASRSIDLRSMEIGCLDHPHAVMFYRECVLIAGRISWVVLICLCFYFARSVDPFFIVLLVSAFLLCTTLVYAHKVMYLDR